MPKTYEELLGLKKQFKKIPKIAEVAIERLHPPVAPIITEEYKTIVEKGIPERALELMDMDIRQKPYSNAIDFSYLANNSSFQRAIMEFIKKFVPGFENVKHRGSKEVMKQSFNQNAHNYRKVMQELKEKLRTRREKIE